MTEREFSIEICNRLMDARMKLLEASEDLIRQKAEIQCLELRVKMLTQQIETAKYRDSLQEAA